MLKPHGGRLINRVLEGKKRERALEEAHECMGISVKDTTVRDIENIAHGVFSPLDGFLTKDDYLTVLHDKRLSGDIPWTIPILLDSDMNGKHAGNLKDLKEGDDLAIINGDNDKIVALMKVDEIYGFDKKELSETIFKTTDVKHPGVSNVYAMGNVLIGGKITLLNGPLNPSGDSQSDNSQSGDLQSGDSQSDDPYYKYNLKPLEVRVLFKEMGWRTIVGFQTRNISHLGHEYVQKTALTFVDGIFINPLIGKKKTGDFKDGVILDSYQALIDNYYLKDRAVMSILKTGMRYAGPREAIFHAIIRKNFGCTHFIIGRDRAGVGNYYGPYDAQDIFEEFPDLGITPLFFRSFFHCKKCGGVVNEKTCPHGKEYRIDFSGSIMRDMLKNGEMPPKEMIRPEVARTIMKWDELFVN